MSNVRGPRNNVHLNPASSRPLPVSTRRRLHDHAKLFLESVSIRGCARISKTDSRFIRFLWIVFLVVTSVVLCISVSRIVAEYLSYAVNVETFVDMDNPSDFPSITYCNHQPFSAKAYSAWSREHIQSPTQYNTLLRNKARQTLEKQTQQMRANNSSSAFDPTRAFSFAFAFDSLHTYYQNLDVDEATHLSHQRNESIHMCFFRLSGNNVAYSGAGCYDDYLIVHQRSDPRHFNCFTIEFVPHKLDEIIELGLLIWLGPGENVDVQHRQAFVQDVFQQAQGLRVVLHEPGRKPDMEAQGLQIEPGRVNELSFEAIRYSGQHSPRNPCLINPLHTYTDLDASYSYEFELCLNTHIQRTIMAECKCIRSVLPRIIQPNATIPYCARMVHKNKTDIDEETVFERLRCVTRIIQNSAHIKRHLEKEGICNRRCARVEYVTTSSITRWSVNPWQLYWSHQTTSVIENYNPEVNSTDEMVETLSEYLQLHNLSDIGMKGSAYEGLTDSQGLSDRYTMLVIRRKNNDTIIKAENLVLTPNALVSRVGGLCSLYIGMTFAVFIELIEFIYLTLKQCYMLSVESHQKSANNVVYRKSENEGDDFGIGYNQKTGSSRTGKPIKASYRLSTDSDIRDIGAMRESYFHIPDIDEEGEDGQFLSSTGTPQKELTSSRE